MTSTATAIVAILAAIGVTGAAIAATKPPITDQAARKIILENRSRWKDPDSIKDARIGQPHACTRPTFTGPQGTTVVNVPATCVCLELNAKNSYGGYTGAKPVIVVFNEASTLQNIRTGAYSGFEKYCVNMKPFPEMNGGKASR